jgi:hypothetical protein
LKRLQSRKDFLRKKSNKIKGVDMKTRMIALALVGLGFFSMCSFTVKNADENTATEVSSNPKDLDVQMILNGLGVATKVDQAALEAKYPSANLNINKAQGIKLAFNNPMAQPYNLDVFDSEGVLVASMNNIIAPEVSLPANMFNQGSYVYKLTGEGNTYAGKFFYN